MRPSNGPRPIGGRWRRRPHLSNDSKSRLAAIGRRMLPFQAAGEEPGRYGVLRRNMTLLMILLTVVPLSLMAFINHREHRKALRAQTEAPMREILVRTRHSGEIFLAERRSAISFITSASTYEQLADQAELNRIFQVMKQEFGGFIDVGLIDASGVQVSYAGPFELVGKDYRDQEWFQEVLVRGTYVSDVFLGYRRYPHFVIAVRHLEPDGRSWIVRATVDTELFSGLIGSHGNVPGGDTFVVNRQGVLQTSSRHYGAVLERVPLDLKDAGLEPLITETVDRSGRPAFLGMAAFETVPFVLLYVEPRGTAWEPWYTLNNELFLVFIASIVVVFLVAYRLASSSVSRIEKSEENQRRALHEMEHGNKLASIGRLAAGVAHEINNPLAIIDQKAGLMMDLTENIPGFHLGPRFGELASSILNAVDRCRTITHRLLGFARRMDVEIRDIDVNDVLQEVLGFLEREALHRGVQIQLELDAELPAIASDRGQLQQVFLNILNNALEAMPEGGKVVIRSWRPDEEHVSVSIEDNGSGMSQETMKHLFEPFFTTKAPGYGTGLGLSITYGIIKKLGGEIQVDSELGKGTTFFVTLPMRASPEMGA